MVKPPATPRPVDWAATAKQLGFENAKAMWTALYTYTTVSLGALASRFGTSEALIKAALASSGIPRRGRGGPNNQRYEFLSRSACELIRAEGIAAAAKRLGVRYTHLHARVRISEAFHARTSEEND